jgi:hypothetical protein
VRWLRSEGRAPMGPLKPLVIAGGKADPVFTAMAIATRICFLSSTTVPSIFKGISTVTLKWVGSLVGNDVDKMLIHAIPFHHIFALLTGNASLGNCLWAHNFEMRTIFHAFMTHKLHTCVMGYFI